VGFDTWNVGLKAHRTSPVAGMSFTFTAPPEPLMPAATAPVSLGVPLGERGELRPHDRNRAAKRPYPFHPPSPPLLQSPQDAGIQLGRRS
jgi:hypothetical protein